MYRLALVVIAASTLALSGCTEASTPAASSDASSAIATPPNVVVVPQDSTAFATMQKLAPKAARLAAGSKVATTSCWTPSQHLFRDPSVAAPSVFRVICRVFYTLDLAQRYTDVVCIGDFNKNPMLNQCYIWKPHLGDPGFSDGSRLASAPPTPIP